MKESREHILNVAFNLFLQKNYKEVTLKEIVQNSALSKGAFYHYFKSKEQVFFEVIDKYFSAMVDIDYGRFSKESLHQFYSDYLDMITAMFPELVKKLVPILDSEKADEALTLNYYTLAFDALKMFPDFRIKMMEYSRIELASWTEAVSMARKTGELETPLSDEEVAKIFIYTNDGVGMRLIMGGRLANMRAELQELWDNLYRSIAAKSR